MSLGNSLDELFKNVKDTMTVTILIVDDSLTMRKIIRKTLEKLGVFSIVEACNGLDALTKLHGLNANLIISDWNMPEMNGIDFVKAVRALEEYNNVPILMVTTVNYKREVFEAVKSGVNGYLVKPFKDDELIQKIQTLLKYH